MQGDFAWRVAYLIAGTCCPFVGYAADRTAARGGRSTTGVPRWHFSKRMTQQYSCDRNNRPPVGEVNTDFCEYRLLRDQHNGSLRPYSRFSTPERESGSAGNRTLISTSVGL
jgi:hypothetical protein